MMREMPPIALAAALVVSLSLLATVSAVPAGAQESAPTATAARALATAAHYPGFTPYSRFGAILRSIAVKSRRVHSLRRVGLSAGGHTLWNVVLTWPMSRKAWLINQRFRAALISDPDRAAQMLATRYTGTGMGASVPGSSVVRPVFFLNCSIHGDEPTGADAGLRLLRRLAFSNDAATRRWLSTVIVVVDPVQNPDGRIRGTRGNANGFDCNRDFITLTQPEDVITAASLRRWVPETMLDLHSAVDPLLCDPTTIPHNPNIEFDLTYKWEVPLADYMTGRFGQVTGRPAQIPYWWGTASDATGSSNEGWDDYAPYYTAQLAQEYGAAAFTVETDSSIAWDGVVGHYVVSAAGLDFTSRHGAAMLRDHVTWMQRGADQIGGGRPWQGNVDQAVRASVFDPVSGTAPIRRIAWGQPGFPYSNTVGDVTFPFAYVVPVDPALQKNVYEAYKALDHAAWYGIRLLQATEPFAAGGVTYPAGTFIVPMRQSLRGLANNLFWDGEDVKATYGVSSMYDVSAWSLKYAYGIDAAKVAAAFPLPAVRQVTDASAGLFIDAARDAKGPAGLDPVPKSIARAGSAVGSGAVRWWRGDSVLAVRMTNECLRRGLAIGMVTRKIAAPHESLPIGAYAVETAGRAGALAWLEVRARTWGLDLFAAQGLSLRQTSRLRTPRVLLSAGANARYVITKMLGFSRVSSTDRTRQRLLRPSLATDFYYSTSGDDAATAIATWLSRSTSRRTHTYWAAQAANNQATCTSFWGTKASYGIDAIAAGATSTTIHVTSPTTLVSGDYVALGGTDCRPAIERTLRVTVLGPQTFTVPEGTNRGGSAGTVTVPYVAVARDRSTADNGFMATSYVGTDVLTAGYAPDGCSFAYPPSWYHFNAGGAPTPRVEATFVAGTTGAFLQGFWNYPSLDAVGSPAMFSSAGIAASPGGRVIASGFNPTYRGCQDNTALLLARAIFLSRCTPPSQP